MLSSDSNNTFFKNWTITRNITQYNQTHKTIEDINAGHWLLYV